MHRLLRLMFPAAALAVHAFAQINGWSVIYLHGKVTMEDGTPPPKTTVIERQCSDGNGDSNVAYTDKTGLYTWRLEYDNTSDRRCNIRAVLAGYQSSSYTVPDFNVFSDPNLPPLTLTQKGSNSEIEVLAEVDSKIPQSVLPVWNKAQRMIRENRLPEAQRLLEGALKSSPKFGEGWDALAIVLERQNKPAEAFQDYRKAIEVDPKLNGAYLSLARLGTQLKDWDTADKTADILIMRDTQTRYPEARLIQAMARYQLKNFDGAISSATEAIRLDGDRHRYPSAEYVLALALAEKKDYAGGQEHMKRYLALLPPALAQCRDHPPTHRGHGQVDCGRRGRTRGSSPRSDDADGAASQPGRSRRGLGSRRPQSAGRGRGPQGCIVVSGFLHRILRRFGPGGDHGHLPGHSRISDHRSQLTWPPLPTCCRWANRDGDITKFSLSLANETQRKMAERVLSLLGWKIVSKDGKNSVEPGDQPGRRPAAAHPQAVRHRRGRHAGSAGSRKKLSVRDPQRKRAPGGR